MHPRESAKLLALAGFSTTFLGVFVLVLFLPYQATASDDFLKSVKPFLTKYCVACHEAEDPAGEVSLVTISDDFKAESSSDLWLKILDQLVFRNMPPSEETQPSPLEVSEVTGWINQSLVVAGKGDVYRKKLLAPEYGNWVNHEELFSGNIQTPGYSPSRLWRCRPRDPPTPTLPSPHGPCPTVTTPSE